MISDSFREACKNFLTKDFSESTIMHQDQLENEMAIDALRNLKDGDVLLLLRVERYDDGLFHAAKKITEILKNE